MRRGACALLILAPFRFESRINCLACSFDQFRQSLFIVLAGINRLAYENVNTTGTRRKRCLGQQLERAANRHWHDRHFCAQSYLERARFELL